MKDYKIIVCKVVIPKGAQVYEVDTKSRFFQVIDLKKNYTFTKRFKTIKDAQTFIEKRQNATT